eukprot:gene8376-9275_t
MSKGKWIAARNLVWNEEKFKEGLEYVKFLHGVDSLVDDRVNALQCFFCGKNLYFSGPTGYGKSLIYQAVPAIADYLQDNLAFTSCVLVVSPLQSLMLDQVSKLKKAGINAAVIYSEQKEDVFQEIKDGGNGIVKLEKSEKSVKLAVFTATATKSTKAAIISALNLAPVSTSVFEKSPIKNNLLFFTTYVGNDTKFEVVFSELINELVTKGKKTKRRIIFCQSRNQTALIWKMFELKLGKAFYADDSDDPRCRIVEMFHAGTPSSVKEHVLDEIGSGDSCLRVLVVTTAFGMGVDCKQVHRVIHFGPSKSIEAYLQECGKAGRYEVNSHCYLLYNGFLTSHCQTDIKEYVAGDQCRTKFIEGHFPGHHPVSTAGCVCCDVCLSKCECVHPCSSSVLQFSRSETASLEARTRNVTLEQRNDLLLRLDSLKDGFKDSLKSFIENASVPRVMMEFTDFQVNQIMSTCNQLFNLADILSKIETWRMKHAVMILQILNEVFDDVEIGSDSDSNLTTFQDLEDEIEDQWLGIRDDFNMSILNNLENDEVCNAMDFLDQSGVHDHSLASVIDYHGVRPFLLML